MPGDPNQPRDGNEMDRRLDKVRSEARGRRLLDDAEVARRANALEAQLRETTAKFEERERGLADQVVATELSRVASKVHSAQLDLGRLLSHATLTPYERACIAAANEELSTAQKTFSRARGIL